MSHLLPRYRTHTDQPEQRRRIEDKLRQIENNQAQAKALIDITASTETDDRHLRLRGIPCIGYGGAIPGTAPHRSHLLRSDRPAHYHPADP